MKTERRKTKQLKRKTTKENQLSFFLVKQKCSNLKKIDEQLNKFYIINN